MCPVMSNRDLRRISRKFYYRHRPVWEFIRNNDEGFWPDLRDTMEQAHRWRFVPKDENGSRITEFPRSRDTGSQTLEPNPFGASSWEAGRAGARETVGRNRMAVNPSPPTVPLRAAGGCWYCGSRFHANAECNFPRMQIFCCGCGERGVTIRTCRNCGPEYRRMDPASAPRGSGNRQRLAEAARDGPEEEDREQEYSKRLRQENV
ncbi:uncharacterized protein LOC120358699 [Solenopsis invicta]|uniref:uncharacterized protein LOC120358699 n=1 Tax=Solenopsis invicta TaxID=13686 RepID=UPI00193E051C|nr:uncharacterized protein LOC120358699 [Solenopsis invicta]